MKNSNLPTSKYMEAGFVSEYQLLYNAKVKASKARAEKIDEVISVVCDTEEIVNDVKYRDARSYFGRHCAGVWRQKIKVSFTDYNTDLETVGYSEEDIQND